MPGRTGYGKRRKRGSGLKKLVKKVRKTIKTMKSARRRGIKRR